MLVVKYVIDGEVSGHCPRKCETVSSSSPHIGQALVFDLRIV